MYNVKVVNLLKETPQVYCPVILGSSLECRTTYLVSVHLVVYDGALGNKDLVSLFSISTVLCLPLSRAHTKPREKICSIVVLLV